MIPFIFFYLFLSNILHYCFPSQTEAYLEPKRISKIKIFCKKSLLFLGVNYFWKKNPIVYAQLGSKCATDKSLNSNRKVVETTILYPHYCYHPFTNVNQFDTMNSTSTCTGKMSYKRFQLLIILSKLQMLGWRKNILYSVDKCRREIMKWLEVHT